MDKQTVVHPYGKIILANKKRRATYRCNILDERISTALWQRKEARLKPNMPRESTTGFQRQETDLDARGWDGERSDHRRAAWGSPSGDGTALNILIVVITQLYVLVNFHRLVHQKDQIVKKFFKFLIFWKKCFLVLYNKIGPLSKFILKMHFNRPIGLQKRQRK